MIFVVLPFLIFLSLWQPCQSEAANVDYVSPTATKGMIVDAGSGGSRLHVFSWQPRIFKAVPIPFSFPEANEQWTARMDPGVSAYADTPSSVGDHLSPLIDFAKSILVGHEEQFSSYPIFFKATGGMRELELSKREELLRQIRFFLSDKSNCPFFFRDDFARVISGEEEAIFSWAATNFLMGTLLPESQGTGVVTEVNNTYGTLDLGGSSTQIAFYVPSQDISEGLFKLQLGGQKTWNVYTKSFLQFGIVSARKRHFSDVVDAYLASQNNHSLRIADIIGNLNVIDQCLHSGYNERISGTVDSRAVELRGPEVPNVNQFAMCTNSVRTLLAKKYGALCDKVYHGDCSIGGAYQPPLPNGKHGHFIGTSSYKYIWKFLMLPSTATLDEVAARAQDVCRMSFSDILFYVELNNLNSGNDKITEFLPYYCFLSSYILVLLKDGYQFKNNQTLTVLDEVNGHKVGWALGAILYEINAMPWTLEAPTLSPKLVALAVSSALTGFVVGVIAAILIYREFIEDKQPKPQDQYEYEVIQRISTVDFIESSRREYDSMVENSTSSKRHSSPYSSPSKINSAKSNQRLSPESPPLQSMQGKNRLR